MPVQRNESKKALGGEPHHSQARQQEQRKAVIMTPFNYQSGMLLPTKRGNLAANFGPKQALDALLGSKCC
eukprot:12423286-Karenia_brevis.AAC.1